VVVLVFFVIVFVVLVSWCERTYHFGFLCGCFCVVGWWV